MPRPIEPDAERDELIDMLAGLLSDGAKLIFGLVLIPATMLAAPHVAQMLGLQ